MKKSITTRNKILEVLEQNPGISSTFISQKLGVTRITAYTHLQKLIDSDDVFSEWNRKLTRYFKSNYSNTTYKDSSFYEKALSELQEDYEGIEDLNLVSLSKDIIANLNAEWVWQYGLRAFEEKIKKENNNIIPSEELLLKRFIEFIYVYLENEGKKKKHGLFSGTQSLNSVLTRYNMPVYIDKLYFCKIFSLMIGRLKWSEKIYWGKKLQNKYLLETGIEYGIDIISEYIQTHNIKYVVYTPPTLKREFQFPNILRSMLRKKQIILSEICAKKRESPQITLKPQKDTKWEDRIINARVSILVEEVKNLEEITEILILDDNFITGATVNSIAEKIRNQGYTKKITVITLTGSFDYKPGITDIGEI